MLSRRKFLAASPVALAAAAALPELLAADMAPASPGLGRSSRVLPPRGPVPQVVAASPRWCRILQITDLHFFGRDKAADKATVADLQQIVELAEADLLIVTGDLWVDNPNHEGFRRMEFAVKQISALGVPWAFCWGNHDQLDDYQLGHDLLESAAGSLYRGGGSHGDYRLEVCRPDDKGRPAIDLLFMNTGREGLTAWQLDWYRRTTAELGQRSARSLAAYAFFHIPVLEYKTRFAPGTQMGVQLEKVCNENEMGAAFPVLSKPGTLRACFCGHDHLNDYVARASGVDLVYGRATGYGGYGGDQLRKGAKLIRIDLENGAHEAVTVFADRTTWKAVG